MNIVEKNKDNDEIMERIFDDYGCGLANFIKPRDIIIHYNDMRTDFRYPADGTIMPIHYYTKIFSDDVEFDYDDFIYYKYMSDKVLQLYELYDFILSRLVEKEIKYNKLH